VQLSFITIALDSGSSGEKAGPAGFGRSKAGTRPKNTTEYRRRRSRGGRAFGQRTFGEVEDVRMAEVR
jgi:hypothetical protein